MFSQWWMWQWPYFWMRLFCCRVGGYFLLFRNWGSHCPLSKNLQFQSQSDLKRILVERCVVKITLCRLPLCQIFHGLPWNTTPALRVWQRTGCWSRATQWHVNVTYLRDVRITTQVLSVVTGRLWNVTVCFSATHLTLIVLMWRIGWAHNNARK